MTVFNNVLTLLVPYCSFPDLKTGPEATWETLVNKGETFVLFPDPSRIYKLLASTPAFRASHLCTRGLFFLGQTQLGTLVVAKAWTGVSCFQPQLDNMDLMVLGKNWPGTLDTQWPQGEKGCCFLQA